MLPLNVGHIRSGCEVKSCEHDMESQKKNSFFLETPYLLTEQHQNLFVILK